MSGVGIFEGGFVEDVEEFICVRWIGGFWEIVIGDESIGWRDLVDMVVGGDECLDVCEFDGYGVSGWGFGIV